MWDSGVRIGEALGLRHEDLAAAEGADRGARVNDNRARAKSGRRGRYRSASLIRLYADYLHGEYGDLDTDYIFVGLWGGAYGHPLTYAAVYDLVLRLRRETGIDFDPHWYRHAHATRLLRGAPRSKSSPTSRTRLDRDHDGRVWAPSAEDARRALEAAGILTGREVRW